MSNQTFFESINPFSSIDSTGAVVPAPELQINPSTAQSTAGEAIAAAIEEVAEAARMIALRRSLIIGAFTLVLALALRMAKQTMLAGTVAIIGISTILLAIAQYVL